MKSRYSTIYCLLALLLLINSVAGFGQDDEEKVERKPYKTPKLHPVMDTATTMYGYADKEGKLVIPYQYDWADSIINGLGRVTLNGKFGCVNSEGALVTPCKYDYAGLLSNGLAPIYIGLKKGLVNKEGKEIAPAIYDHLDYLNRMPQRDDFENILFETGIDKKFGVIDGEGKQILPVAYDGVSQLDNNCFEVWKNGKGGIITSNDSTGIIYSQITALLYEVAVVEINNKKGLIDRKGNYLIPAIYDEIDYASRNLRHTPPMAYTDNINYKIFCVGIGNNNGLVHITGKKLTDLKYQQIDLFNDGYAIFVQDGKYGLIDTLGKEVIAAAYDTIQFAYHGYIVAQNGRYGTVNSKGQVVTPLQYDAVSFAKDGFIVYEGGKYGAVNKKGKAILPVTYDEVSYLHHYLNNGFIVSRDGKYGTVNAKGKIVIPMEYDKIENFGYALLLVSSNGISRVVTEQGHEVLPAKYAAEYIHFDDAINEALYETYKIRNPALRKAKILLKLRSMESKEKANANFNENKFDLVESMPQGDRDRLCQVGKSNNSGRMKYGFVNNRGEVVIPLVYDRAGRFYYGEDLTCVVIDKKAGFINREGRMVIPFKYSSEAYGFNNYDNVPRFTGDFCLAGLNGGYVLLNKTGKEIIADSDYMRLDQVESSIAFIVKGRNSYRYIISNTGKIIKHLSTEESIFWHSSYE